MQKTYLGANSFRRNQKKKTDNSQDIINRNENVIDSLKIDNLSYLYPNGHRITHQMRWLKVSRERGLESDIAA